MGSPSRPVTKERLRRRIWSLLTRRCVTRFPFPVQDRIPNFVGAEAAARRVAELDTWTSAQRLKCNPDAPQRPIRLEALRAGKTVFMAVPRLRTERCFLELDPKRLRGRLAEAASIAGATALGRPVPPEALERIDLVVAGSVAVNRGGARLGKGGGYSDLEWALLSELGIVDDDTPVLTTVHELQVIRGEIPMTAHDVPLDFILTPEQILWARRRRAKPTGIVWAALSDEQLSAMPVLRRLRLHRGRKRA